MYSHQHNTPIENSAILYSEYGLDSTTIFSDNFNIARLKRLMSTNKQQRKRSVKSSLLTFSQKAKNIIRYLTLQSFETTAPRHPGHKGN